MLPAATACFCTLVTALLLHPIFALQAVNPAGANSVKFVSKGNSVKFANSTEPQDLTEKLFSQVTTDLHRFTKTGIHADMIEQPYCSEREPSKALCSTWDLAVALNLLLDLLLIQHTVLPSSATCLHPALTC